VQQSCSITEMQNMFFETENPFCVFSFSNRATFISSCFFVRACFLVFFIVGVPFRFGIGSGYISRTLARRRTCPSRRPRFLAPSEAALPFPLGDRTS
jgi:hypothetical protein